MTRAWSMPLVTGLGCISACGADAAASWEALVQGRTGIRPISGFDTAHLRNRLAGEVESTDALRGAAGRLGAASRISLFTWLAVDEALADAGLSSGSLRGRRAALVLGTSLGMSLARPDLPASLPDDMADGSTGADFQALARLLGGRYGLEAHTTVVSTACASATHAIALAMDMIRQDEYDCVVAGGADTLDRLKYLGHSALSTLTTGTPRPFSSRRDGTLFGEGAGFLVLERDGARRARPAYARCLGAGFSTDIGHMTAPDPEGDGAAAAMLDAVADAGIEPGDVDHVNLHGSGTPLNDAMEALALAKVFGERSREVPCTTIKPSVGHAMGAAGALEAVATVLSIRNRLVPPTVNVTRDELAFPINLVCEAALRVPIRYAITSSFGFGGANGAVVFGRVP